MPNSAKQLRWLVLAVAIGVEVAATLALKAALTSPIWYVVVVAGYASALGLLAVCLRLGMPVGVAYGIWGASGVTLTAVLSAVVFGEALTPVMLFGIALIVCGVLIVEIGSQRAQSQGAGAERARSAREEAAE